VRARSMTTRAMLAAATMATDDSRGRKDIVVRAARAAWAARAARAWATRALRVARMRSHAINDHKEEIVPQIAP
jgi:hypothetical protein